MRLIDERLALTSDYWIVASPPRRVVTRDGVRLDLDHAARVLAARLWAEQQTANATMPTTTHRGRK